MPPWVLSALLSAWKVAKFSIPIPIGLIVAVAVGWKAMAWWDKTAAVKQEVESRIAELVTQAEKKSLEAKLKAANDRASKLQEIADERDRLRQVAEDALAEFEERLRRAEQDKVVLQEDIDDILAEPLDRCFVDLRIYDRLRNE